MDYLRQVQRAVDHIEVHLDDALTLTDVSAVAGVSHWHFQRMFRALTKETLAGYIRSRRLSRARLQLLNTNRPVLDVALSAGFGSQAAFTRAFKRQHGVPPATCRATGRGRSPVDKVRLDAAYVRHLHGRVSLSPVIAQHPARHLVGMATTFTSMEAERNRQGHLLGPLWDAFTPRFSDVADRTPGVGYGVIAADAPGRLTYLAAVEVSGRPETLPEGFVYRCLPASTWATFSHRGAVADLDHTVNYVYACWLLQSGRTHTYGADLEVYDERFDPGSPDSIVDYAIPLR